MLHSKLDTKSVHTEFSLKLTSSESDKVSFSPNNPPNLLNYAVRDGGLNAETNSMSDADGGMPEQRGSFHNTGGSGSATTRSLGQGTSSNLSSRS